MIVSVVIKELIMAATATVAPVAGEQDWSSLVDAYETDLETAEKKVNELAVNTPAPTAATPAAPAAEEAPAAGDTEPTAAEASFMTKVLRENIINVKADVEVQQKDPNSPLYSVKTFEELHLQKKLLDGVF